MKFLPSASRHEMAEFCLGSAVLPGVDYDDGDAAEGRVKHRFLEMALNESKEVALAAVEEKKLRTELAGWDLSKYPAGKRGAWAAEVALAFDIETGQARELGRRIERDYVAAGLKESELPGSMDLFGETADAVVIGDYKTGHKMVAPARRNAQLRFGAVAAARLRKKSKAIVFIQYTRDGEEPYTDVAELDAFDLDDRAAQLTDLGRRVRAAREKPVSELRLVAGDHCRNCPAIASCPAQTGLIRRFAEKPDDTIADLAAMLTPETAALVYGRIKGVKEAVKKVEAALYAYAAKTPIPLGDGYVLGLHTETREYVDGESTFEVLKELHGPAVAQAGVAMEASKASIKRALEVVKVAEGGTTAERMRVVLAKLRARGGVTEKPSSKVTEHRPEKKQLKEVTPATTPATPAAPTAFTGKSMQELLAEEERLRAQPAARTKDLF